MRVEQDLSKPELSSLSQGLSSNFEELERIEIERKANEEAYEANQLSYNQDIINTIIIQDQISGMQIRKLTLDGINIMNRVNPE